jgi:hypothetical protein
MCQSQNRGGRAGLHHQGRANRPINVFSTLPGALPVRQAQGVMRDIVFAKQAVGRFLDRRTIASAREG